MKRLLLITTLFIASIGTTKANSHISKDPGKMGAPNDSLRLVELDHYWTGLSRTVRAGDFEGYKAAYHADAVIVFASGNYKESIPITTALANWKQGFNDTKSGKTQNSVDFCFSQRIRDETTAHETGIFFFKSTGSDGKIIANSIVHFEMLLVKRNNTWYGLMEYQKSAATQEEWESLE